MDKHNRALCVVLCLSGWLAVSCQQSALPPSPCPTIFTYSRQTPGRWDGSLSITTDVPLYGVWIDIVLDNEAESVGNWFGDVSNTNNREFKIDDKNRVLNPGTATSVDFFVRYAAIDNPPRVSVLRLNGREICKANRRRDVPVVDNTFRESESPVEDSRNQGSLNAGTQTENERPRSTRRPTSMPPQFPPYSPPNYYEPFPNAGVNSNQNPSPLPRPRPNHNIGTNHMDRATSRPVQPNIGGGTIQDFGRPQSRPADTYNQNNGFNNADRPRAQPEVDNQEYDTYGRPVMTTTARQYVTTRNTRRPLTGSPQHNPLSSSYNQNDYSSNESVAGHKKKPQGTDTSNDYFGGDHDESSKISPARGNPRQDFGVSEECGKVAVQAAPLIVGGQATFEGQWPWHVALYQSQTVDSKYICGGSLISASHVITAAHCVTRKGTARVVNSQTLTVYLGKFNLRKFSDVVQIMFVRKIYIHPEYNATSFSADIGILKLTKPSDYTNYVRPVCLWKESEIDLSYVIGREGSVVGWGYDETSSVTEELTVAKMPVVEQTTCLWSFKEFFTHFTSNHSYCAGYANGTSVCNGDSGGGMVFPDSSSSFSSRSGSAVTSTWRLRGLVSISVARQNEYTCDPYHYVVFTDIAQYLDWITQKLLV